MNRAVFLDRDGVLNQEGTPLVTSPDIMKVYSNAAEAIRLLKDAGFKIIIVTNQPVVARGLCTEEEVRKINQKMIDDLGEAGQMVDSIYFCPHHPEKRDDVPEWAQNYRIDCGCRKPKPGMLLQAAKDYDIDLGASFMVGDSTRDILAGQAAGCKTLLVKTGFGGKDGKYDAKPDAVADDVLAAAKMLWDISNMPAVILAGGRGERLRPLTDDLPKPLLPVAGKPVMEWQLDLLKKHGIKKVAVCGHYMLAKLRDYFGDGSRFGLHIEYFDDGPEPLGSGGALKNLEGKFITDFLVLSGDVMTKLDITALALSHRSNNAIGTITVRETDHPHDSDIIQMDEEGRAVRFYSKKESGKVGNLGNTGACMLNPEIFSHIAKVPCSLEGDLLSGLIHEKKNIRCYLSKDYFKDMGTPERYESVQKSWVK